MWIPRTVESLFSRLVQQRPIVVVTGARQTGKTSLVRRLLPDFAFVSLDLPSEAAQAEHEPAAFLVRHGKPLVVDEVQYAPGLFRHLKAAVDADRAANGQFVLTGSQKPVLMQAVSESLAGRAALIELEGLTLAELSALTPPPDPVEVAARGTLPELWEKPDLDASLFYRSYVATYLERDLRQILNVTSLRDFERFLRACALRSAQLLNKAELARDVGISPSTAAQWLAALEASNQLFFLEPWFSNRTKSLTKTPKLYLTDPGLWCLLVGIRDRAELMQSPLAGAAWETLVCSELRRQIKNGQRPGELFFWRDRTKEIDFLIHRGGRFELFDAKWTEHPTARETAALRRVAGELPERAVLRRGIICRTGNRHPIGDGVEALPLTDA